MNHLAEITNPSLGTTGAGAYQGQGAAYIVQLISVLITSLLIIGSVSFVLYFLLGAISWITSSGDAKAAEAAKTKITQATIGIFIMFAAWAVFQLVETLFGISLLSIDLSVLVL